MNGLNESQKTCFTCQAELRATDKFCRHCGIKLSSPEWAAQCPTVGMRQQTGPHAYTDTSNFSAAQEAQAFAKAPRATSDTNDFNAGLNGSSTYQTNALETNSLARPISGPLLKAVANGVAIERAISGYSRVTRSIIMALMSVPVWLMIILLSPLDAWTTTRAITRQM